MEKRIELERRARKANQILELNLDNCRSTSIVGLTDEYTALETLSLINVGLTTLKGFPKLPNLKKLELSDNRISSGLHYLTTSPKLQYLNLSGNKIKDLETLKPLKEFKNLNILDLFNNDATQVENYREKIFKMLPSLNFLDGFDCNDEEVQSEGDDDDEVNGNDSEDEVSGGDDDEEDSDESEDGDNGDVSLSEVYNDDLEEDNSDWEEGEGGDEDEDEDSDIDEADGDPNESAASVNNAKDEKDAEKPDETHARGKKRKHDG
ncbi:PREDICTED: acidic leucine-rich nuclear phosphoprotein 32 family member A isoform X2 [Drosophila arizonae]|uniref:Acidic leucine-rich nuclear phosphoprotein 32 family member A isoform X2 n=1 Tax=Drosophila arizonae TaxID=7263 RepID=A0ABM1PHV6_DROAR|nr:PREDICTED: acidic leucine-rich nuclear phosphoprotein 32 family member A isoform X2 [Drosophila arizonae]